MFTQCQHCQAIFNVSMREVTVAKGKVRCGECHSIFNASDNLSTTRQDRFVTIDINKPAKQNISSTAKKETKKNISAEELLTIKALDSWQSSSKETKNKVSTKPSKEAKPSTKGRTKTLSKSSKRGLIAASLLSLLLLLQLAYNYRHLLLSTVTPAPDKIQMLNHNIFAHPIEQGALLISASIENTAEFDQPYPYLEVKLSNENSELVALRRFSPKEYLDNYSKKILLPRNKPTSIKLKIRDPGNQATRFQFNFM